MVRNIRNHGVKHHNALASQLAGTNNLPSLPHITAKLLDILTTPDVSIRELADVIKLDPALSLNVMRLAESITNRSSQTVRDVEKAVEAVGSDTIAHMVRWSSTLDVFNTYSFCSPRDLTAFWAHSVKSALLAEGLARELDINDPGGAYLAGLLHDVGKLFLLSDLPTKYKLQFSGRAERENHCATEESLVENSHASVGAALVRRWRHHSLMADAIQYHHHPTDAVAQSLPLVKIVFVANLLATDDPLDRTTLEWPEIRMLELSAAQLDKCVNSTNSALEELSAGLGIEISAAATDSDNAPASFIGADIAVADHVRDTSLLGTLAHSLLHAEDADAVFRLVEQTLHEHFDVDRVVFLLLDGNGLALEASGQCCDRVGELTIPLSFTACSPVLALTQQRAVDSFAENNGSERSIMDDQIVNLLGREGMWCLPMMVDEKPVGVLALGIDRVDLANLSGQKQLIARLSQYTALAVRQRQIQQGSEGSAQQDTSRSDLTLTRQAVHEVNNPLGIINNYLNVLGRRLTEQNIAHDEIRIISEEIARIRNILATLVESSREASLPLTPVDLNAVLSDLLSLMKEDLTLHRGIQLHSHLSPSIPKALADKDILKQAIINLLKNSAEALPDGGNIHVETMSASVNGSAQLIIRDDGPGIPETVRAQLFQPFVTSKAGHEGLGLSVVHRLVEQLSGTISCDCGTNSGTQFTICLPLEGSKP